MRGVEISEQKVVFKDKTEKTQQKKVLKVKEKNNISWLFIYYCNIAFNVFKLHDNVNSVNSSSLKYFSKRKHSTI